MKTYVIANTSRIVADFVRLNEHADLVVTRATGPGRLDEFDPNHYLKVLPNLRLQDGYTLDFDYSMGYSGGGPLVFAKRETGDELDPLKYLLANGSPESFFELEVFKRLNGQFSRVPQLIG